MSVVDFYKGGKFVFLRESPAWDSRLAISTCFLNPVKLCSKKQYTAFAVGENKTNTTNFCTIHCVSSGFIFPVAVFLKYSVAFEVRLLFKAKPRVPFRRLAEKVN